MINYAPYVLFLRVLENNLVFELDLIMNGRKRDLCYIALRDIALRTISSYFSLDGWLHIYTDMSVLDFSQGAGVFSDLFFLFIYKLEILELTSMENLRPFMCSGVACCPT